MAIRTPGNAIVRRLGITIPRLRGVRREGGPAATGIDQFWDLQNVVPVDGLSPRGGQQRMNAARLPGMTAAEFFNGMFDESVAGASVGGCGGGGGRDKTSLPGPDEVAAGEGDGPKLYWFRIYSGGQFITFFDEEKTGGAPPYFPVEVSPALASVDVPPYVGNIDGGVDANVVFWRGELWWPVHGGINTPSGHRPSGWGLYSHPPAVGAYVPYPVQKLWVPTDVPPDYNSEKYAINGMIVHRDKVYFVLGGPLLTNPAPPPNYIHPPPITYEYDGVALKVVDAPSGLNPACQSGLLIGVGDYVYVAYLSAGMTAGPPAVGYSVIRRINVVTGAVDVCTVPAAGAAVFNARSWADYKGKLYLFGFEGDGVTDSLGKVYSITPGGTNFTEEHSIGIGGGTTGSTGGNCGGACVFNGYTYYINAVGDGTGGPLDHQIGRFDGFTWDDAHVDMATGDPLNPPLYSRLVPYKGSLVALPNSNNAARRSQGTNTAAPWNFMQPHYGGTTPDEKHINSSTIAVPE